MGEADETESTEDTYDENDNEPGVTEEEEKRREYVNWVRGLLALTVHRTRNGDHDVGEADETESTEDTYDENDNKPGIAEEEVLRHEYDAQEDPRKLEEAHIMSIGEDTTHWDFDALTIHSKPRARRNRWDAGPPPADTDANDKSWDTRQPPADFDATNNTHTPSRRREAHTLHTPTRHTHIHAGRSESGRGSRTPTHAHPPPTPDHPSFPDTPHQGRSECSPCSIGVLVFNRKNTQTHRCAAGRHAHIDSGS